MFPVETISAKMLDYYVGRKDAFIIDLRSYEEYHSGHIQGAVNLPYEEFEELQEYNFPKGKVLVLYCDRGGASLLAARLLARKGYETRMNAYRGRKLVCTVELEKPEAKNRQSTS